MESYFRFCIIALTACSALTAGSIDPAPIDCQPASVAVYISQRDNGGCRVGLFNLLNFAFSSNSGGDYVAVSPDDILVTPVVTSTGIQVLFTSDAFEVSGQQMMRVLLDYTIDPPPPILDDLNLEMFAESPIAPGVAQITTDICIGSRFIQSCPDGDSETLFVRHLGDGNPNNRTFDSAFGARPFPRPVNLIDVRNTIELFANGAYSQIDGFGTTTTTTDDPSADETPEPATAVLGLTGMAAGLYFRSLRARNWRSRSARNSEASAEGNSRNAS